MTDIGSELAVTSLRKKKHQRSQGRESGSSSERKSQEREERRKSLEIEKRRRSVEILYGRESSDRESGRQSAERDSQDDFGQRSVKRRDLDSRESPSQDQKRRDWDSQELAAAVAGQAAAIAGLEQKMERIIGQVILYQNVKTNINTNTDTNIDTNINGKEAREKRKAGGLSRWNKNVSTEARKVATSRLIGWKYSGQPM